MSELSPPLLSLTHLHKSFTTGAARFLALDDVSLSIAPGEIVGLVGESGSGKSTLARAAVGLIEVDRGERHWQGRALTQRPELAMQLIFQDAAAALNPRSRVAHILSEAPRFHGLIKQAEIADFVAQAMQQVGLDPALAARYPHQLSGGQRTRVGIARALAMRPKLLICDEIVASLDVSIQAQILNLLIGLRAQLGLACLFIGHDLSVVRHISDRVAVMYLGRIVEIAPSATLFQSAQHPYTQALLAHATLDENQPAVSTTLHGELPSPFHAPSGCHLHPRCLHASVRCQTERPVLKEIAPSHWRACHLVSEMI